MKKTAFTLGFVALSLLVAACSASDDPAPFANESPVDSVAKRLSDLTGANIVTGAEDGSATPHIFFAATEGRAILPKAAPQDALAFLASIGQGVATPDELGTPTEWRSAAGATTLRFPRLVPGTHVPVFDTATVLGVRDGGELGFLVNDSLPSLRGFDVSPAISEERARQNAAASVGIEAPPDGVATLGVEHLAEGFRLAYRVEFQTADEPWRVVVDAKTGAVLRSGDIALDGRGPVSSAEAYYPKGDPRAAPTKTLPVTLDEQGRAFVETLGGTVKVFDFRTKAAVTGVEAPGVPGIMDISTDPKATWGIAANVQYNVAFAAEYFARLGVGFGRPDRTIPVFVHGPTAGNASYDPTTRSIVFGDGMWQPDQAKNPGYLVYSPGASLDATAHEFAHAVVANLGLPIVPRPFSTASAAEKQAFVDTRSLHEGLADVFGSSVEAFEKRTSNQPMRGVLTMWEGIGSNGRPARDLLHPRGKFAKDEVASHASQKFPGYIPVPGEKLSTEALWKASVMAEAYFRSGIASHAWALMAVGGVNDTSTIGIEQPLGFEGATTAYGLAAISFRYGKRGIRDFAEAMISTQLLPGPRATVGCAWAAVGVLAESDLNSRYGITCRKYGVTCAGKADGIYCDPTVKFAAYQCKGGSIAGGTQCKTDYVCQRTGVAIDSPAVTQGNAAVCAFRTEEYEP